MEVSTFQVIFKQVVDELAKQINASAKFQLHFKQLDAAVNKTNYNTQSTVSYFRWNRDI